MIIENLPLEIKEFLEAIEELGFSLCLVGGTPRDFFFNKSIGSDFDFEIRPNANSKITITQWPNYYLKLHDFFKLKNIKFEILPYLITRVHYLEKAFEFSSPRIEVAIVENYSHHHFEAILDPNLSYKSSFIRRDLSINAIGIEFNFKGSQVESLVDPYNGVEDLKQKILNIISNDFFLDPNRFLRLIRMSLKFDSFTISEIILNQLHLFNLTAISNHHFSEELFKSNPSNFLNTFSQMVKKYNLEISPAYLFWTKFEFPKTIKDKDDLLVFIYSQNEKVAIELTTFFSMPEKKMSELKSFHQSYQKIAPLVEKDYLAILDQSIEIALKNPILKDLKNLDDKKQWRERYQKFFGYKNLLVQWRNWENIEVSSDELFAIDSTLRSYYRYYKTLKKIFLK